MEITDRQKGDVIVLTLNRYSIQCVGLLALRVLTQQKIVKERISVSPVTVHHKRGRCIRAVLQLERTVLCPVHRVASVKVLTAYGKPGR